MGDQTDPSAAMRRIAAEDAARVLEPQPDLLGLPVTQRGTEVQARRGPGRPPGARNKRAEDIARFIVEEIGDPLIVLAQLAVMPADELAARAGCTVMDALVEKRLAAIGVLPYVHQRQALAVNVQTRSAVYLSIVDGKGEVQASGEAAFVEVVEFQQVNEGDDAPV